MLTVTSECVLILLKSTAALVQISSLFWSFSLRVCYAGTDQWHSVTSEGCWLCSPFVTSKFCDSVGTIEEFASESCIFAVKYKRLHCIFISQYCCHCNCLELMGSGRHFISNVSAAIMQAGPVSVPRNSALLLMDVANSRALVFKGPFKLYLKAVTLLWARLGEAFTVRWVMTCAELWPEML